MLSACAYVTFTVRVTCLLYVRATPEGDGPTATVPARCKLLSTDHTDHELIPARNASLAAMHGSASGSNVRYYPT
jgi:hypothetical protein